MRQLWAITRRETGAFFHSSMAPAVLVGFLVAVGLFFTLFLLTYSDMSINALQSARTGTYMNLAEGIFRPLVSNMILFLLILVPAVTMRLFAPEYKSGRYALTASWPVTETTWVWGKWLSAWITIVLLIVATAPYFGIIWFLSTPEVGPVLSAWLGLFLYSASLVSLGVLFSVLFSHQVVAYFLTFATAMFLFLVGSLERFLPGVFGDIAYELSLMTHFERFSRGVLDSRDVLFFLGLTVVCLTAATAALASRRLPGVRRPVLWTPVLIVTVLVVIVYLAGIAYPWNTDLTGNKRYSLAPQTVQVLEALEENLDQLNAQQKSATGDSILVDDNIHITGFYQNIDPARSVMEVLLRGFSEHSNRLSYSLVDPEENLDAVNKYGISVARSVVVENGNRSTTLLQPEESALVNAVYRMATDTRPVVLHLLGHGEHLLDSTERSGYSLLDRIVREQGYHLRTIYLAEMAKIPASADVLVIAGPRLDPLEKELEALDNFINGGGAVLAMFDPPTSDGWVQWLKLWNIRLTGDVMVTKDPSRMHYGVSARTLVVTEGYSSHEITKSLEGVATVFPLVQPLRNELPVGQGLVPDVLLISSPASWAERNPAHHFSGDAEFNPGEDLPGPLPFGATIEVPVENDESIAGRLTIIGNSEFLNNANLELGGNRDLLLNALGWLAREETLINLRGRDPLSQPVVLTLAQKKIMGWGSVLGWPLLVGSLGLGVMLRQRREREITG